jgi:nucleoside-triphosphate--adenylate kinase
MTVLRFVITGAPGTGKGTICSFMTRDFGFKHLSAGDLLRSHVSSKTKEGLQASSFLSQGKLVPDYLITSLMMQELTSNSYAKTNILLDGFPRTLNQAKSLDSFAPVSSVLNIVVPQEEIIRRISGRLIHEASGRVYNLEYSPPKQEGKDDPTGEPLIQRNDDRPETVRRRLREYERLTTPILNHYQQQGLLASFEGKTSDQIYQQIRHFLQAKNVKATLCL